MSKFSRFLTVLLFIFSLVPLTHATNSSDQPLTIKSAVVETEDTQVVGQVKVCNTAEKTLSFLLNAKNTTINMLYKRNLSIESDTCSTFKLQFSKNFREMSNIKDGIEFSLRDVQTVSTKNPEAFKGSDAYITSVSKGEKDKAGCADTEVKDGVFVPCVMDFLQHTTSNLRIKVMAIDPEFITLKLVHIEWGGIEDVRIYTGRSKQIRSAYKDLTRVVLSNVSGDKDAGGILKIESEK